MSIMAHGLAGYSISYGIRIAEIAIFSKDILKRSICNFVFRNKALSVASADVEAFNTF